jgi:hypothetical protein
MNAQEPKYSRDPKTGHPNNGNIRKPDVFSSGFQMGGGHFVFLNTSLDHFVIKYFLFMTPLLIKRSRLVDHSKTGPICPVFEWFVNQFTLDQFACQTIGKPDKYVWTRHF